MRQASLSKLRGVRNFTAATARGSTRRRGQELSCIAKSTTRNRRKPAMCILWTPAANGLRRVHLNGIFGLSRPRWCGRGTTPNVKSDAERDQNYGRQFPNLWSPRGDSFPTAAPTRERFPNYSQRPHGSKKYSEVPNVPLTWQGSKTKGKSNSQSVGALRHKLCPLC